MVRRGDGVQNYIALHEKYGPVVRTGPFHVSVADPQVVPLVYGIASKFRKSGFYSLSVPFYEGKPLDNMFTAVDPGLHRALRAPTVQVFSMTNLRNYEKPIDECTEILMKMLHDVDGQVIDYTEWFQWYAFDVISSITFQSRLGFLEKMGDVDEMFEGSSTFAYYFGVLGQLPWLHPYLLGNQLLLKVMTTLFPDAPDPTGKLFTNIEREIQRYDQEEKLSDRKDFLSQLRAKDDPDREGHKRDLMNSLSNNILAGSETTAISLRSIFYFLSKTPRAYKTLVSDILEAQQAGRLSSIIKYDEAQKLPFLQAVIKEALRLHAPTCFPLERIVPAEGTQIGGYFVPGGCVISTMAPLMNKNTEVFGADAEEFRPERWLNQDSERLKLMERTFFTFGHGSRSCIGKNIALLEITKLVPQILREFDVSWASPKKEWTTESYWFCMQKDVVFRFTARDGGKAEE
ncbi:hypothetical protein LTS17_002883 [Exophiala oligosperma]